MNIITTYPANKENYLKGRYKKVQYIVIHYTASPNDTAKGEASYFHNNIPGVSANYFVDANNVYMSVDPNKDTAYHCGTKGSYYHKYCRNNNSLGIEICTKKINITTKSASDTDWYFDPKAVKNAIELTKIMMAKYNVPIENVIRHYDVTHKVCPAPFVHNEKLWNDFKAALIEKEDNEMVEEGILNVNGKVYKMNKIVKEETNFFKLADFNKVPNIAVAYDANTKTPKLTVHGEAKVMQLNGKDTDVTAIEINDTNYVKLQDLKDILDLAYIDGKVVIKTK